MSTIVASKRTLSSRLGFAGTLLLFGAGCSGQGGQHADDIAQVQERLAAEGVARVSVLLKNDGSKAALSAARVGVEGSLAHPGSRVVHNFKSGPGMSLELASEADLQALAQNPDVDRFSVSPQTKTFLDDSRGIVGADEAFAFGYNGAGRRVGVIDTGVATTHDDLQGDLVDEACFCSSPSISACDCPDGNPQQFGPGSSEDTNGHGTHVSGIITSDGTIAPRGIAPEAEIVVVKAVPGSFDDATAGMEWLEANHPELDAVNMSFGASGLTLPDDCDLVGSPPAFVVNMANAIQALRDEGIISVAASGNDGDKAAIGTPACISTVFSVGASNKNNTVASFSNSSPGLDILATGDGFVPVVPVGAPCLTDGTQCVLSTGLADGTAWNYGTSMASPHVAAAVSLVRQADSDLSPEEVEACLLASPTLITDGAQTDPLLDIPAALEACGFPLCNAATYEAETMFHSTGGPVTDGWNIWSNGFISTNHDFTAGPNTITVRARGQSANGVAAHMIVRVGGAAIGNVFVPQSTFTPFTFTYNAPGGTQEIRVEFDNDFFQPPADRNLFVDNVVVDCAEAPTNPCAGICENPQAISWSGSYQGQNLGTGAICRETMQPVVGGNCGNFAAGRQLSVNGVPMPCDGQNWASVPPAQNGGYCVSTTTGDYPWAFVTLW